MEWLKDDYFEVMYHKMRKEDYYEVCRIYKALF